MIVGVDFATEARNATWMACGHYQGKRVVLDTLDQVSHATIRDLVGARVIGIDVPLGWPDVFQKALRQHRANVPVALQAQFPERLTDLHIKDELQLTPLSVAAQLIGRCTWQASTLLSAMSGDYLVNPVAATNTPCVIEVYPKAVLRKLAGKKLFDTLKAYKRGEHSGALRSRICDEVLKNHVELGDKRQKMVGGHDALDAVLAMVAAFAFEQENVVFPPDTSRDQAAREGWIYYPKCL